MCDAVQFIVARHHTVAMGGLGFAWFTHECMFVCPVRLASCLPVPGDVIRYYRNGYHLDFRKLLFFKGVLSVSHPYSFRKLRSRAFDCRADGCLKGSATN